MRHQEDMPVREPAKGPGSVDVRMAYAHASAGGAVLVDVRTDGEFAGGHAPGAVSLPLHGLAARMGELPADRPVYAVCRSGHRSGVAAAQLAAAGRQVSNVEGGMLAWERAGLPVERGTPVRGGILSLLRRR